MFLNQREEKHMASYIVYISRTTLFRKIYLFHFLRVERSYCFDFTLYFFLLLFVLFYFPRGLFKSDSDDRDRNKFFHPIPFTICCGLGGSSHTRRCYGSPLHIHL